MIDLPDSATFAAALADRRIYAAVAVAALAGLVRGFSGFGGAMIYMPLVAAIYDPRIAAVTILLVDFLCTTPFAIPEIRRCNWREVWPISIAMAVGVPFGTWLLLVLDPIVLRWGIAIIVLSLLPPLAVGWRYRGEPRLADHHRRRPVRRRERGRGADRGPAGDPLLAEPVGSAGSAVIVRANIMVFFMICGVVLVAIYAWEGLFTAQTLALALLLGVPYIVGVGIGAFFFTAPRTGSTAASPMAIIALAALLSVPVLDPLLR